MLSAPNDAAWPFSVLAFNNQLECVRNSERAGDLSGLARLRASASICAIRWSLPAPVILFSAFLAYLEGVELGNVANELSVVHRWPDSNVARMNTTDRPAAIRPY